MIEPLLPLPDDDGALILRVDAHRYGFPKPQTLARYACYPSESPAPLPYTMAGRHAAYTVGVLRSFRDRITFRDASERIDRSPRKDVFLYIHGYNNTFEDAAFGLAELWHFLGREGLPIIYTWPAGHPGIFGYTYDRESSEFTVYHLKQTISWLSAQPEIQNIHIIAHSRGTDVALSALRELIITARAAGINPRQRYKLANLVLAAPDLDLSVVSQRMVAERIGLAIDEITLYSSPADKAIGIAERLFASPRGRLGTLDISEISETEAKILEANAERITVVNFKGEAQGYGHSYFRTNPAVSSDLERRFS